MNLAQTKLNKIHIPPRFRENMGDLDSLGESIEEIGQIQTIAVREFDLADRNRRELGIEYELLAGGRRLLAMKKKFGDEHIVNVTVFPHDLSEAEKLAIELVENVERKDFDWREEAALKKKLHEMLTQAQDYRREEEPETPEWTQKKTAEALGVSRSLVTTDLGLADAMEKMPELFEGAKDRREAMNLLAKAVEKMATEELASRAERKGKEGTLGERRTRLINAYHFGDFFEWAAEVPSNQYDLVEFDPDYGVDFGFSHSASSSEAIQRALLGDYKLVSREVSDYTEYLERALRECYRLAKKDAWLILWFAQDPWFEIVFGCMERSGWNGKRLPGIWFKDVDGRTVGNPDKDLGRTYETFFYAHKGSARINKRAQGNLFSCPSPRDRIHPTEKPRELMSQLYSTFCKPGSKILIPHLGSGNGILAALDEGMSAEGCDLNNQARNSYIRRVMERTKKEEEDDIPTD